MNNQKIWVKEEKLTIVTHPDRDPQVVISKYLAALKRSRKSSTNGDGRIKV